VILQIQLVTSQVVCTNCHLWSFFGDSVRGLA